jgi:hypothetical protein
MLFYYRDIFVMSLTHGYIRNLLFRKYLAVEALLVSVLYGLHKINKTYPTDFLLDLGSMMFPYQ